MSSKEKVAESVETSTKWSDQRTVRQGQSMQVFCGAPVNDFFRTRWALQNLHQNDTGDIIGLFSISRIFEGDIADSRDEISQGGIDAVSVMAEFHGACFYFKGPSAAEPQPGVSPAKTPRPQRSATGENYS